MRLYYLILGLFSFTICPVGSLVVELPGGEIAYAFPDPEWLQLRERQKRIDARRTAVRLFEEQGKNLTSFGFIIDFVAEQENLVGRYLMEFFIYESRISWSVKKDILVYSVTLSLWKNNRDLLPELLDYVLKKEKVESRKRMADRLLLQRLKEKFPV